MAQHDTAQKTNVITARVVIANARPKVSRRSNLGWIVENNKIVARGGNLSFEIVARPESEIFINGRPIPEDYPGYPYSSVIERKVAKDPMGIDLVGCSQLTANILGPGETLFFLHQEIGGEFRRLLLNGHVRLVYQAIVPSGGEDFSVHLYMVAIMATIGGAQSALGVVFAPEPQSEYVDLHWALLRTERVLTSELSGWTNTHLPPHRRVFQELRPHAVC